MFSKNFNIRFRIINLGFVFVLFLIILSNFPHHPLPVFSWLNSCIYFLLFLQAIYLFKQERRNKDIFFNISIFALFHSLGFANVFIGKNVLTGNDYHAWYFYEYLNMLLSLLFTFSIIYICIKYFLKGLSKPVLYIVTFSIILPIFIWRFYPFLADKAFILENDLLFDKSILLFNFLPLFFVVLYGALLYKYDWSLGEHINTIMVCFFIMLIMDITNLAGNIYNIIAFELSQYVLSLTLTFFIITLFRRLNYVYSEFGQFYDSIVVSGNDLGVPIKRKKGASVPLLEFAQAYFHQRRNTIGFASLISIFFINYFNVPPFLKLNLAVICFGILILFVYLTALYEKRLKNDNLIN